MSAQKNEEKPNEFTLIQFLHKLVMTHDDDSSRAIDLTSDLSELELVERTILYIKNLQKRLTKAKQTHWNWYCHIKLRDPSLNPGRPEVKNSKSVKNLVLKTSNWRWTWRNIYLFIFCAKANKSNTQKLKWSPPMTWLDFEYFGRFFRKILHYILSSVGLSTQNKTFLAERMHSDRNLAKMQGFVRFSEVTKLVIQPRVWNYGKLLNRNSAKS